MLTRALRRALPPPVLMHGGGWDEILLFFGAPITLFVGLRWLGIRRERREALEQAEEEMTKDEGEDHSDGEDER